MLSTTFEDDFFYKSYPFYYKEKRDIDPRYAVFVSAQIKVEKLRENIA